MREMFHRIALVILIVLSLASCASTKDFVSPIAVSDTMSIDEKLSAFGGERVSVPYPEVFFDGTEWMARLTQLIEEAEDYILISTFLGSFSDSEEGLFRALMEAAERGIDVYFIMDGISSYDMTETQKYMTPLYFLKSSGIHLIEYNPLSGMNLINPMTVVIRDHRKLIVIDGEMAAIGGMNLNYISIGAGEGRTQRDSTYLFESSSLSRALMKSFVRIWNESSVEKIDESMFPIKDGEDGEYSAYLFNMELGGDVSIPGMYSSLFNEAEERVILFPYLPMLDKNMKSAVREATERGVDVDFVMPVDLRGYAASGVYQMLPSLIEDTGVGIYITAYGENGEILPLLHEKLMVVDSDKVVIGSANFNFRSMKLSHELALVIESEELAAMLTEHAEKIMAISEYVDYDEAERRKAEEGNVFSYLFTYFGG